MAVLTQDVLRIIGKDGIVVGSVANGAAQPKDIDLVIKSRGQKDRNPVFTRLKEAFPTRFDSEGPGHVYIQAYPLLVELFEYDFWDTQDAQKNEGRISYAKAKKQAVMKDVLGVPMLVMKNKSAK